MDTRNIYIFDLDDTLYQIDPNSNEKKIISLVDKSLLDRLDGVKILFSNAQHSYCQKLLQNLQILSLLSVVLSANMLAGLKPDKSIYDKVVNICGLKPSDNIVFFDNLGENLQPAKLLGWTTVHIDQVYLPKGMKTCDKIDFIDYTWGNINEALEHFISLIKK